MGAPPVKFDAQFLSGLKATEFGLYGRNTRGLRRNQAEDTRNVNKAGSSGLKAPKFLSEKARELATSQAAASDDKADELAGPFTELEIESKKSEVPVMYRNVEIKYSKFGVDDFDFGLVPPRAMAIHGLGLPDADSIIKPDILDSRFTFQTRTPIPSFRLCTLLPSSEISPSNTLPPHALARFVFCANSASFLICFKKPRDLSAKQQTCSRRSAVTHKVCFLMHMSETGH